MWSEVSCTWNETSNSSPGSTGQLVISQPVDEPFVDPSAAWLSAHSNPVPARSVSHVPSGHPSFQQHSEKAELIAT